MATSRWAAVTGVGMITPLGADACACWSAFLAGRSGIGRITRFDCSDLRTKIGGELPPEYYEIEARELPKRLFKQTAPVSRLGFLCGREALADSGFELGDRDPYRYGVLTGCALCDLPDWHQAATGGGNAQYLVIRQMVNAVAAWITMKTGFKGPSYNIGTACASGAFAITEACSLIRDGRCDGVLVVGVDTQLSHEAIYAFSHVLALSEQNDSPETASCPFDRRRSGFVLANGSGAVFLENMEHAAARSARIYAAVRGTGMCSEAYNIVAPEPSGEGMARSMSLALADAGKAPEEVGYVNAHGTSTRHNDAAETSAIKLAFGDHARRLAVSSQKSMIGHTIAAAGAIECVVTALSLRHGVLTPTINYAEPDPACDLDYVPNEAREVPELKAAISNSFGFGGHNCSIVMEKV